MDDASRDGTWNRSTPFMESVADSNHYAFDGNSLALAVWVVDGVLLAHSPFNVDDFSTLLNALACCFIEGCC